LPVFLNKATRLVPFMMGGMKRYRATMRLGIETDTQDREGRVIAESRSLPADPHDISRAVLSFKGVIAQVPPMYSALKHHGTPLYKLARKGLCIDRAARSVIIHDITVLDIQPPQVTVEVDCSPGTYIRTLCADIGNKLGCGAHLSALTRLRCGSLALHDAVAFDDVAALGEHDVLKRRFVSLRGSLSHLPMVMVTSALMSLIRTRKTIPASHLNTIIAPPLDTEGLLRAGCDGESEIALIQSLATAGSLPAQPDTRTAWKRVCLYNPQENTIH
jgi:tRNA pseudouridine55 synthase